MPKAFLSCVKRGGRVRTVCHGSTCRKVCWSGGKSYAGHTFTRKKWRGTKR